MNVATKPADIIGLATNGRWLRLWRWASIGLMGLLVSLVLNLVFGVQYRNYHLFEKPDLIVQALCQSAVALVGIRAINTRLDTTHPWNQEVKHRLWRQFVLNLGYVLVAMILLQVLFALMRWLVLGQLFITLADEVIITIAFVAVAFVVVLIDWGLHLLSSWRQSEALTERYRKETIEFQFEMLRNQVNPHFLFNNLNTISGLVHENPTMASEFVRQMSRVYRYLLEYQSRELISLAEEEEFLTSYIYLVNMRFGPNVIFQKDLPVAFRTMQIVPVSLQMLVENAIKHNIASKSRPLTITIAIEYHYLVVANNLQLKKTTEYSSRLGLNNIVSRYQFLTPLPVLIEPTEHLFTVKLPLLTANENSDRRR